MTFRDSFGGLLHQSFVEVRVEFLAGRVDLFEACVRENLSELVVNHLHAFFESFEIFSLVFAGESTFEIVLDFGELFEELAVGCFDEFELFFGVTAAEVFEFGHQAQVAVVGIGELLFQNFFGGRCCGLFGGFFFGLWCFCILTFYVSGLFGVGIVGC